MKKILLSVFLFCNCAFAADNSWWDDFVTISGTSYWIGDNPGSGTQLDGHNFGTIGTLTITGADLKYWNADAQRTGGAFYWMIKDQSDNIITVAQEVIWMQSSLGGGDYQGIWSGTINVLDGLSANTTYKLHIWAKNWGSTGDRYLSNDGLNYVATFTTDGSVPIELSSFTATTREKIVSLKWQTTTEVNNYGFEIERASSLTSPVQGWLKLGFINGHGNSNSPKSYSFTDKDILNGIYSYRLKQIDTDGKYEYSPTVEVTVNNMPTQFELSQNYPNPFNPSTVISYALPSKEFVQLKVFNVLGNEIATLVNEVQEAGNYKVEFTPASSIQHPATGVYFYRLEAGSFVESRKMTLVK